MTKTLTGKLSGIHCGPNSGISVDVGAIKYFCETSQLQTDDAWKLLGKRVTANATEIGDKLKLLSLQDAAV